MDISQRTRHQVSRRAKSFLSFHFKYMTYYAAPREEENDNKGKFKLEASTSTSTTAVAATTCMALSVLLAGNAHAVQRFISHILSLHLFSIYFSATERTHRMCVCVWPPCNSRYMWKIGMTRTSQKSQSVRREARPRMQNAHTSHSPIPIVERLTVAV